MKIIRIYRKFTSDKKIFTKYFSVFCKSCPVTQICCVIRKKLEKTSVKRNIHKRYIYNYIRQHLVRSYKMQIIIKDTHYQLNHLEKLITKLNSCV